MFMTIILILNLLILAGVIAVLYSIKSIKKPAETEEHHTVNLPIVKISPDEAISWVTDDQFNMEKEEEKSVDKLIKHN